jgi:hypothetical protein
MRFLRVTTAALAAALCWGAPALTTVQDVLYKADGTRFNGVALIEWKSFESADYIYIPTHNVTAQIVDGQLLVRLVPTTGAEPPAYYSVRYSSGGRVLFQETWNVPPSTVSLKLRDVRQASSAPGAAGPEPLTIADVQGLETELSARPAKGVGYAASRTAVIAADGSLEAALGNPSDCVRVDGTTGPCGTGGGASAAFMDGETPAGVVDGANMVFTLSAAPDPAASLHLYRNGLLQKPGLDFTLSGSTLTFVAGAAPLGGDTLLASFRVGGASGLAGGITWTMPQVLCGGNGTSTASTSWTELGTCTIPADVLGAGDHVEVRFHFVHGGTASGFEVQGRWGANVVASRSLASAEAHAAGRADIVVSADTASWTAETWTGTAGPPQASAGESGHTAGSGVAITLAGRLLSAGTNTLALRGYTVVRYPAQMNP